MPEMMPFHAEPERVRLERLFLGPQRGRWLGFPPARGMHEGGMRRVYEAHSGDIGRAWEPHSSVDLRTDPFEPRNHGDRWQGGEIRPVTGKHPDVTLHFLARE